MVKNKNKSESGRTSQTGQARRIGIFGASGSGKTTKARELTQHLNRIVFIDPLGDFIQTRGAKVIYGNMAEFKKTLERSFRGGFRIVFVANFGEVEQQLNEICYFLVNMQAGYLAGLHNAQITLCVDELDEGFRSGIMQRNAKNGFGFLCKRGRHYGINLIGISQRTAQVDVCFRGNLSDLYLFRHVDPIDTQKAVDMLGREYKTRFMQLNNYQYFYKCGQAIVQK